MPLTLTLTRRLGRLATAAVLSTMALAVPVAPAAAANGVSSTYCPLPAGCLASSKLDKFVGMLQEPANPDTPPALKEKVCASLKRKPHCELKKHDIFAVMLKVLIDEGRAHERRWGSTSGSRTSAKPCRRSWLPPPCGSQTVIASITDSRAAAAHKQRRNALSSCFPSRGPG